MSHKIYMVKRGDTLERISRELGIPVDKIREYHNRYCELDSLIGGDKLPRNITEIIIPRNLTDQKEGNSTQKEKNIEDITFEQKTRYRCQQINTSKMDGNLVHYVKQKFQYLLKQNLNKNIGAVKLEDYIYNFEPSILNNSFDFIGKTEFIRNDVIFSLDERGMILSILNKDKIYQKWEKFKNEEFDTFEFIKRLKETNSSAVKDLKTKGDMQFSPKYKSEEEYRRNLFYFICFDQFLYTPVEEIKKKEFPFISTIVPPLIIPLKFKYDKVSEQSKIVIIRKVSNVDISEELEKQIKQKYDEMYKPNIQYNYTEYKIDFRVKIELNVEEKLVDTARLVIREQIADNVDNTCEFQVKRLEDYTS